MTFPLVKITWLDATDIETGWLPLQEMKDKKLLGVESVGWLIKENEEKITLIACWDETDQNGGAGPCYSQALDSKTRKIGTVSRRRDK